MSSAACEQELLEAREGELAISHHGSFLKADERRIQYQRISHNNGKPKDYAVRLDGPYDPERRRGYVVVQLP